MNRMLSYMSYTQLFPQPVGINSVTISISCSPAYKIIFTIHHLMIHKICETDLPWMHPRPLCDTSGLCLMPQASVWHPRPPDTPGFYLTSQASVWHTGPLFIHSCLLIYESDFIVCSFLEDEQLRHPNDHCSKSRTNRRIISWLAFFIGLLEYINIGQLMRSN